MGCFVSQRYWKMKAIHNRTSSSQFITLVVLYPKDTEKWKQFTTGIKKKIKRQKLFCIPKILKNESNSQRVYVTGLTHLSCFVSQRYWKMKAIHNTNLSRRKCDRVVLYPKDTEKWKQFTTFKWFDADGFELFCIPKILKNESNSQRGDATGRSRIGCFVSQRYWKMKAIHNWYQKENKTPKVVLYPKDTEKWKQFTTSLRYWLDAP